MDPIVYEILTYLFFLYIISTVVFLIMDNRDPQATFAWMLLFLVFPIGGLLIYLFFGRDLRVFSRQNKLAKQDFGRALTKALSPILAQQYQVVERLSRELNTSYVKKILGLMYHTTYSALTICNTLEILQNAREKFPRLVEDIKQAQHSIHLQYFIWESDEFTEKIKELLLEKAKAGIEVRILYDALGSFFLSWRYIYEMRAGGIQIYPYSPVYKFHTISYRNHRKIGVIDGAIAYTGGFNMGQEHLDGGPYFSSWRDTHLRLTGEAAKVLQGVFVIDWYNATGEQLSDDGYFPPVSEEVNSYLPVQIVTSGPDSEWAAIKQLYFFMILAAEKHVYIQSPFFIPDQSISDALKAAALAGIDIKLMCSSRGTSYDSTSFWAANTYFQEMARAGIRIFLYRNDVYFHPKTINIDSKVCSIGSANMDIRSFIINYEVNAVIYDEKIAQELADDFARDLEHCTEFSLAEYHRRNFFLKLRDSVARLFSPLL